MVSGGLRSKLRDRKSCICALESYIESIKLQTVVRNARATDNANCLVLIAVFSDLFEPIMVDPLKCQKESVITFRSPWDARSTDVTAFPTDNDILT